MKKNWCIRSILALCLVATFFNITSLLGSRAFAYDAAADFQAKCSACHSIGKGKLIGPDLKGVHERRELDWIIKFVKGPQAMMDAGDPIALQLKSEYPLVMPNQPLDDEQIKAIVEYIKGGGVQAAAAPAAPVATAENAASEEDPHYDGYINPMLANIFFPGMLVILALSVVVGIVKKQKAFALLSAIAGAVVTGIGVIYFFRGVSLNTGYMPTQPIPYSHKLHAGQYKIPCQYCHFAAEKGRHGGIPPAELCLNCHKYVKTDSPHIQELVKSIENNKPMQWVKVHHFPDFAYFNHSQHVRVGKIACQKCHGPIEKMDEVRQYSSLSMGWCIDCHRENKIAPPNDHKSAAGGDCARCHH